MGMEEVGGEREVWRSERSAGVDLPIVPDQGTVPLSREVFCMSWESRTHALNAPVSVTFKLYVCHQDAEWSIGHDVSAYLGIGSESCEQI